MVKPLSFTTIANVLDSWEALRRIDNYEVEAGKVLFQKLFELCPPAKVLFGFPVDMDIQSEELLKSKRFIAHASYLISMIETSLDMLGPDIDLLTEIMEDLGHKHVRFGVKGSMFGSMGKAIIHMLDTSIGDKFTKQQHESWQEVYGALVEDMLLAQG